MNKTNLEKRIYKAQCYGNVEPIEYMTPYPNLPALVEGQNVKYKDHLLYHDLDMTNEDFFKLVQKTTHWLKASGAKPKDRVLISGIQFPWAECIAFAVWTIGGTLVISNQDDYQTAKSLSKPKLTVQADINVEKEINAFDEQFEPEFNANLQDEALIYWANGKGIRLSHYNLLVNANGAQKKLDLFEQDTYLIQLKADSTAWVVLQAILPLYTGAGITSKNPKITISLPNQFNSTDYIVDFTWTNLKNTTPPRLFITPENTAVVSVGSSPVHMTKFELKNQNIYLSGHSVMMGYFDEEENENIFTDSSLVLQK